MAYNAHKDGLLKAYNAHKDGSLKAYNAHEDGLLLPVKAIAGNSFPMHKGRFPKGSRTA